MDSRIVDSSIWSAPLATRVVWITILAKSNHTGFVSASKSGLLRASNVPEKEFEEALVSLESPDPDSRTTDYEGRRIEKVEGGWIILNYLKYREYTYSDNPDSIRQRKYRKKIVTNCDVSQNGCDISASASASASASEEKESMDEKTKIVDEIYILYPTRDVNNNNRSTGKGGKDKKKIEVLLKTKTKDELISTIKEYLEECSRTKTWLKNFSVFLNHLPEPISKPELPKIKCCGAPNGYMAQ